MNSELIKLIEQEAEAERLKILEAARTRATEVMEQARSQAGDLKDKHRVHSLAHQRAEEARAESAANLQAMSVLLQAKSRIIGQVFQEAHQSMSQMPRDRHRQVLKALLQEAGRELGDGLTVLTSRDDLKTVQDLAKEIKLKAELKADPQVSDGIVAIDQAGRSTVLNRFADRLERARPGLMAQVSEILWG